MALLVQGRIVRRLADQSKEIVEFSQRFDTYAQARTFARTKIDEMNLADLLKSNLMITMVP